MSKTFEEQLTEATGIKARLAALAGAEPKRIGRREFTLCSDTDGGLHVGVRVFGAEVQVNIEYLTEAEAGEVLRLLAPYFTKRKGGG